MITAQLLRAAYHCSAYALHTPVVPLAYMAHVLNRRESTLRKYICIAQDLILCDGLVYRDR